MFLILSLGLVGVLSARLTGPVVAEHSCCVACGYDLAGLEEAIRCPECGYDGPRACSVIYGPSLTLDGARLVRSVAVLAVWIFVLIKWREIATPIVALKYRVAGVPWDTARWCVLQNELNPWRAVDQGIVILLGPLLTLLCLMPFTVRLSWRRWFIVNAGLGLVGLLWLFATAIAACL